MRIIGIGRNRALLEKRGVTEVFESEATALPSLTGGETIIAENPQSRLLKAFTEENDYGIRVFDANAMDAALTDEEAQKAAYLRESGEDEVTIAKSLHVPVENVLRDRIFKSMIAE